MKDIFNTWKSIRYLLCVLFLFWGVFRFDSGGRILVMMGLICAVSTFVVDRLHKKKNLQ